MIARRRQLRNAALAVAVIASAWLCLHEPGRVHDADAELPPLEVEATLALKTPAPIARPALVAAPKLAPDVEPHPHPITPAHVRLAHERQLIQQLNDLLDLRDGAGMRPLVAAYAREFPDDPNAMVAGYEVIADCLQDRSERVVEAAREYYERERASTLRRYVRRVCFE